MTKTLALAFVLALAACGGKKAPATTTTTEPPAPAAGSGEGTPCAQEIMLTCPDGQVDACTKTPAEGDVHKCVAQ